MKLSLSDHTSALHKTWMIIHLYLLTCEFGIYNCLLGAGHGSSRSFVPHIIIIIIIMIINIIITIIAVRDLAVDHIKGSFICIMNGTNKIN